MFEDFFKHLYSLGLINKKYTSWNLIQDSSLIHDENLSNITLLNLLNKLVINYNDDNYTFVDNMNEIIEDIYIKTCEHINLDI